MYLHKPKGGDAKTANREATAGYGRTAATKRRVAPTLWKTGIAERDCHALLNECIWGNCNLQRISFRIGDGCSQRKSCAHRLFGIAHEVHKSSVLPQGGVDYLIVVSAVNVNFKWRRHRLPPYKGAESHSENLDSSSIIL